MTQRLQNIVESLGFASLEDFNSKVASVDLSTPENVRAFKLWQEEDGTAGGLARLQRIEMPLVLENDDGIRPAGGPAECFYCQSKVGTPHRQDCVAIHKRVKVEMTAVYEVEVPYDSTPEQIEFQRNGSSWCASNALDELAALETDESCLCGVLKFRYLKTTEPGPYAKPDCAEIVELSGEASHEDPTTG